MEGRVSGGGVLFLGDRDTGRKRPWPAPQPALLSHSDVLGLGPTPPEAQPEGGGACGRDGCVGVALGRRRRRVPCLCMRAALLLSYSVCTWAPATAAARARAARVVFMVEGVGGRLREGSKGGRGGGKQCERERKERRLKRGLSRPGRSGSHIPFSFTNPAPYIMSGGGGGGGGGLSILETPALFLAAVFAFFLIVTLGFEFVRAGGEEGERRNGTRSRDPAPHAREGDPSGCRPADCSLRPCCVCLACPRGEIDRGEGSLFFPQARPPTRIALALALAGRAALAHNLLP